MKKLDCNDLNIEKKSQLYEVNIDIEMSHNFIDLIYYMKYIYEKKMTLIQLIQK